MTLAFSQNIGTIALKIKFASCFLKETEECAIANVGLLIAILVHSRCKSISLSSSKLVAISAPQSTKLPSKQWPGFSW